MQPLSEGLRKASLRIETGEADAVFLGDALLLQPDFVRRKGELINPRNPLGPVFEASIWSCEIALPFEGGFEERLEHLARVAEEKGPALASLRHRILGAEFFCLYASASGQGCIALPPELMARFAAQQMHLRFDLYLSGESD